LVRTEPRGGLLSRDVRSPPAPLGGDPDPDPPPIPIPIPLRPVCLGPSRPPARGIAVGATRPRARALSRRSGALPCADAVALPSRGNRRRPPACLPCSPGGWRAPPPRGRARTPERAVPQAQPAVPSPGLPGRGGAQSACSTAARGRPGPVTARFPQRPTRTGGGEPSLPVFPPDVPRPESCRMRFVLRIYPWVCQF